MQSGCSRITACAPRLLHALTGITDAPCSTLPATVASSVDESELLVRLPLQAQGVGPGLMPEGCRCISKWIATQELP